MKRALLVLLFVLLLPGQAAAQQGMLDLGPQPWKCNFGGGGCYGYDSGPGAMDDSGIADITISPHHVRPGGLVTVTAHSCCSWKVNWNNLSAPGLSKLTSCSNDVSTCDYVAGSTSNSWIVATMTFPGCPNVGCPDSDYYAITNAYAIEGNVMDREQADPAKLKPARDVEVTATGAKGSYRATTGPNGDYTIFLPPDDTYAVATAGRHCVKDDLPSKCTTSKSLPVAPDQKLNFEAPPKHKVSGTVKDADGNPVADIVVLADDAAGGGRIGVATSKADGTYSMTVPTSTARFSSADSKVCVLDGTATACTQTRDLVIDKPTTVNFRIEGCVTKIDFGTRMIAKGPCFDVLEKDKRWKTDEGFWMNGLRIYPNGDVTFDKPLQTIVAEGQAVFKLRIPGGEEIPVMAVPKLLLNFSDLAKEIFPSELSAAGSTLAGLAMKGSGKLEWGASSGSPTPTTAGTTTLTLKLDLSDEYWLWSDNLAGGTLETENKRAFTVKTTLENDVGLRRLDGEFTTGDDVKDGIVIPPGGDAVLGKRYLKIKKLAGSYDFLLGGWRFTGAGEAPFLSLAPAGLKEVVDVTELEATLDTRSVFVPYNLAVKVDALQKPLPWGFFLQRLRGSIGADQMIKDAPFAVTFGIGLSLAPRISKKELASLDGDLTLFDADRNPLTLGDVGLGGKGELKVIGTKLLDGRIDAYPGQASAVVEGNATFEVPVKWKGIDGGKFGVAGKAAAWLDGINTEFGAEGSGTWSMPFLGSLGVNWWADKDGIAGCFTDTPPLNETPEVGGVKVGTGAGKTNNLYGMYYKWGSIGPEIQGCEMLPYKKTKPTAKGTTAAVDRSFKVPRATRVLAVEVRGTAPFTVGGPSGKATVPSPAKSWIRSLPNDDGASFVLVKPKRGKYTVGGKVSRLRYATQAPEPSVQGELVGGGCTPVLKWSAKRIAGQEIHFIDAGDRSARMLGSSTKARGSLKVPQGATGHRTIIAKVFQGGALRRTFVLDGFDATSVTPAAPSRPRAKRSGGKVKVSWTAACDAAGYLVTGGGKVLAVTKETSATVTTKAKAVTITSLDANAQPGGSITRAVG